jgi:hypothetical protein
MSANERKPTDAFEKFLDYLWKRDTSGKAALLVLYLGVSLPFIFNVVVLAFVSTTIWPLASSLTEKLAVLGFLFLVLNAIAYQIRNTANSVFGILFEEWLRRRKQK